MATAEFPKFAGILRAALSQHHLSGFEILQLILVMGRNFYDRKQQGTEEPFVKVKEESEKAGLKLNIQKTKIMVSGPITSWQIDGETVETVTDYFSGFQNHCRW